MVHDSDALMSDADVGGNAILDHRILSLNNLRTKKSRGKLNQLHTTYTILRSLKNDLRAIRKTTHEAVKCKQNINFSKRA